MQKFFLLSLVLLSSVALTACSQTIPQQPTDTVDLQKSSQEIPIGSPTSITLGEEGVLGSESNQQTQQGDSMNQGMPTYDAASITELQLQEIQPGTGEVVQAGNTVAVHYTGQLPDGTVFDSSIPRNQPFVFTVGAGQVIQGWDEGLIGMKEGGKRRLLIPASKGYGANGIPGAIPPNSPLIFEVELINIQ
jgi:FKBP-type peptidyl-prolyl cis-trans isomerase